jgi:dihydrofolate reductase
MITIIVAIDRNNGIGYNNRLLAHIPGDLRRFREITMGHCLIMGKNTWESLPNRPLAGRKNIVLTDDERDYFSGAERAFQLMRRWISVILAGNYSSWEADLYTGSSCQGRQADGDSYPQEYQADTFFPKIDPKEWYVSEQEDFFSEDPLSSVFHIPPISGAGDFTAWSHTALWAPGSSGRR